jgi:hypothetical protein
MTIHTSPQVKSAAPRRLDWVAPSVHKLAAGSAEEEGFSPQSDLGESFS